MFEPVSITPQRFKRDKRLLYQLAVTEMDTFSMKKVFDESTPGLPERDAAVQLFHPIFITGEAITQFTDSKNQIYTRHITLKDANTGKVILQRFGPSSLSTSAAMKVSAKRGKELFKVVSNKSKCKKLKAGTRQTKAQQTFPHFHFGAWYDRFKTNLVLTGETQQTGNKDGKRPVTQFCAWFKEFAVSYIQPLVNDKGSGLCDVFRHELLERQAVHFPWACKQVRGLDDLCHSLYATISPFNGFSGTSHVDDEDADVSILVNFGQHAVLELRHYNCQIVMQPLDIVVFLSNSIYHRTLQHQAHVDAKKDPGDRLAITCFFRKALQDHKEPTNPNLLYLAKISAEEEKERKRKNKATPSEMPSAKRTSK